MLSKRELLHIGVSGFLTVSGVARVQLSTVRADTVPRPTSRVRPGDSAWPSKQTWGRLSQQVGNRLLRINSPLEACVGNGKGCETLFEASKNPYYLGDNPALTQTLGWVDAWKSTPSEYAVIAETTQDVVAAVNFARDNNLRLVVKGGGHSYLGRSNAPDSLLIWTRRMNFIELHDAFVPTGCAGRQDPQPAVTIGAGAAWSQAYDAVTTQAGRYVEGGGCLTVGVAGLLQSGGFGSFSKAYGMASSSLLEAEVVTADGAVRIVNACLNPDLFWAIKGGGGGSLGVVTRVTLRTHELPDFAGGVFTTISARTDSGYRKLIAKIIKFYRDSLYNPHWGEQIALRPDNTLSISMVFQGLDRQQAEAVWRPLFDWVAGAPDEFGFAREPTILALPARHFWDPMHLGQLEGVVSSDDRPDTPRTNIYWVADSEQAGQVLHGYQSTWLPSALLFDGDRQALEDALYAASRSWSVSLHFNKGLAGAPSDTIEAALDTAVNPAVVDAFALAICGGEGPPAYPGIPGYEPDKTTARRHAKAIRHAMGHLRALVPAVASYMSESDFFEENWQESFWGANYPRLLSIKDRYDPEGLFFVHHGVGSERWSSDGFTRRTY